MLFRFTLLFRLPSSWWIQRQRDGTCNIKDGMTRSIWQHSSISSQHHIINISWRKILHHISNEMNQVNNIIFWNSKIEKNHKLSWIDLLVTASIDLLDNSLLLDMLLGVRSLLRTFIRSFWIIGEWRDERRQCINKFHYVY